MPRQRRPAVAPSLLLKVLPEVKSLSATAELQGPGNVSHAGHRCNLSFRRVIVAADHLETKITLP